MRVARLGGLPYMSSPIRNTLAANQSDAATPAAPAAMASSVCQIGGGVDEASRSMITKLLMGGTNVSATASVEFGSRLIGIQRNQGIMMTSMTGVISPCASRSSFTADPTAAMNAPTEK